MTEGELRAAIRKIIAARYDGVQKDAAVGFGISEQYLCDFLAGRRAPGKRFLKGTGFTKSFSYVPVARLTKCA